MLRNCYIFVFVLFTCVSASAQGPADHVRAARAALEAGAPDRASNELHAAISYFDEEIPAHWANLAFLYNELFVAHRLAGADAEALDAVRRAVALSEGIGAAERSAYLTNLGQAASARWQWAEAEEALVRAARIAEGSDRSDLSARAKRLLGETILRGGDPERAASVLETVASGETEDGRRATVALIQTALMRHDPVDARQILDALDPSTRGRVDARVLHARVAIEEGRLGLAEQVLHSVLEAATASGDAASRASALYNLAEIAFLRGLFAKSESFNQEAEHRFAEAFGDEHPAVALAIHRRAVIHQKLGDYDTAKTLYRSATDRFAVTVGKTHPYWISTRAEAAQAVAAAGDRDEAEKMLRDVLERLGSRPDGGGYLRVLALAGLGLLLHEAGDPSARVPLEEAFALRAVGNYPRVDEPPGLIALAEIDLTQSRLSSARSRAASALDLTVAFGGTGIDGAGEARRLLAAVALAEGHTDEAITFARQNVAGAATHLTDLAREASYVSDFAPVPLRAQIGQALDLMWDSSNGGTDTALAEEMFQAAQLLHLHETTRATNGVAARLQSTDPTADRVLSLRAQTVQALRAEERRLFVQAGVGRTDKLAQLRAEKRRLEARIASLDPDIVSILTPQVIDSRQIAASLEAGEALWMQASFDSVSYLFLVTDGRLTVAQSPVGADQLVQIVAEIRASVDVLADGGLPPFAFDASRSLNDGLFAPFGNKVEELEALILVPDGAVQQVSPALIGRDAPERPAAEGAGEARFRYLGLSHALSVVPSPQIFVQLRAAPRLSLAGGFVGFGDPDLSGEEGGGTRSLAAAIDRATGLADPNAIRTAFGPLRSSAVELEWMAESRREADTILFLSEAATEAQAKSFDYAGSSVVVFATHAVVAGEFDNLVEPALILSPPAQPNREDDGLLTAGEIAQLRIRADMVILSACNTGAASGRVGAPGLSGLATGFFRAGARSVVVSHWTIRSISSVVLMPTFLERASEPGGPSPSEALRLAMLDMANVDAEPRLSHPALWAPFTVIGDR